MTDYRKMIEDQQKRVHERNERLRLVMEEQLGKGRTVTGRIASRGPLMHNMPVMVSGESYARQAQSAERSMNGMEALLIAAGWSRVHDGFFMTDVDSHAGDIKITVEKGRQTDNPFGPLRYDHPTGRLVEEPKDD